MYMYRVSDTAVTAHVALLKIFEKHKHYVIAFKHADVILQPSSTLSHKLIVLDGTSAHLAHSSGTLRRPIYRTATRASLNSIQRGVGVTSCAVVHKPFIPAGACTTVDSACLIKLYTSNARRRPGRSTATCVRCG